MRTLLFLMLSMAAATVSAAPAQSFSGVLASSDPVWESSRHYDTYTIEVAQNQQVTVHMTSSEFDTYLIVRGPDGTTYTNDDYESQSVSHLEFLATAAGNWMVMASAYDMQGAGSYTVDVTLGAVGEVETMSGRLDPTDPEALKGEYYDTHTIEVSDDRSFTVELTSFGFDGYLVVRSADGETWRNDDAESTTVSRIGPLSGVGTWTVIVTTASSDQVGAYDLKVIRFP